ncbi:hypothetical protein DRJ17_01140 [Candidatus Woesearchaeota archaeon]|nr:MAG: hypothetical protein DRJ17_01140 [Candidatus Woesearchaeota archaeon]
MAKNKKRLTRQEEFDIMKLVLDKFLWLGFGVMVYGLYNILTKGRVFEGFAYIVAGAIVLIIFMILIVREYEIIK